ncbi:MAG TPA: single-stranded-DNA-specific exonuclease RecJ, partial [Candidatus Moranbacteria bacterium]|nr:single-stranded-DNA-specific exonuclease RecJ [Candidatus Moranbacteria bacterium]
MIRWRVKEKAETKNTGDISLPPVILNLLFQRGINTEEKINHFISPDYDRDVRSPFLFSQMGTVIERIGKARDNKELVVIFGDYDADGITSTAILKEALDNLGIKSHIHIPDKKKEGYSMNSKANEEFKEIGAKLIITVDCGITNKKEIKEASECGIDTIIIDHHHIPAEIPDAYAIINPKMENSGYPEIDLAGVGVTFKVVQAIYEKFLPDKKDHLKWMLDIVAIGTVADCVPLLGENRIFVKYGLIVLSKTRKIGLQEIFNTARLKIDENNVPDTYNISFQIAPRINAAGRVDHANTAYNLIMEKSQDQAKKLASELESNNQNRQKMTTVTVKDVKILAEKDFNDEKFIFAVGEDFPIGIVGLVAGKIADAFNKPTAVIRKEKNESQGSFRSIPQLNIIEAIEKCSEYLIKFGGHPQAAGIKIANENLEKFHKKLSSVIESELEGVDLTPEIEIDAEIKAKDIGIDLVEALDKIEPFGVGNKKPVFLSKDLSVEDLNIVGSNSKHLKLFLRPGEKSPKKFEAIGFNMANEHKDIKEGDKIDAVFNLEHDE